MLFNSTSVSCTDCIVLENDLDIELSLYDTSSINMDAIASAWPPAEPCFDISRLVLPEVTLCNVKSNDDCLAALNLNLDAFLRSSIMCMTWLRARHNALSVNFLSLSDIELNLPNLEDSGIFAAAPVPVTPGQICLLLRFSGDVFANGGTDILNICVHEVEAGNIVFTG